MTTPLTVVTTYFEALESGDLATVAAQLAEDVVWHQPGENQFSGVHRGSEAVGAMIGGMMAVSEGTFSLKRSAAPLVNGELVAASVHWTGTRSGAAMDGDGIDLMRVVDGKVVEVWLFTADPAEEDAFWGRG